jgi:hypothetical protein
VSTISVSSIRAGEVRREEFLYELKAARRAGDDTAVTGKPAHRPPRATRTLAAGQAVRTSEAAGSRRVPVALPPGRLADLPVAIPASLTLILEPVLGTPTTPRPPHPPKRRPDPVQHGSPSSLPRDPLSSSADTGTRSRGAGPSRLAARTPWGHIGATSLPSVTDNTGHERSANVPGQQLTSASIAGPLTTLVLSRTEEARG